MQIKVNKPQVLNISSVATKTETEQKEREPQGRVEDRYYTIQEYKALSNEQKKELKDLQAYSGHNLNKREVQQGFCQGTAGSPWTTRTEKLLDHLEVELLPQIIIQPDTPIVSGLPEFALSPSTVNLTVS